MNWFVISFLQQARIGFEVNDCYKTVKSLPFPPFPLFRAIRFFIVCECLAPFRVFPLHLIQAPVGGTVAVCMPFYARVLMSACVCGAVLVFCVCELHDSWVPANSSLKLHKKRVFFFLELSPSADVCDLQQ